MKKITTAKKGNRALIIDDFTIVQHSNGEFTIHQDGGANGTPSEFDPTPFVGALDKFKREKEEKRLRRIQQDEAKEKLRLEGLKERITKCENPVELVEEFSDCLTAVEIAGHWSDLYEGHSKRGLLISGKAGFEVMEMAISIHGIKGQYGESTHRAGEHHHTFTSLFGGLKEYQNYVQRNFEGDNYFYRSPETEAENTLSEIHNVQEGHSSDLDKIEKIKGLIKSLEEIDPGYYDCDRILAISDSDLGDDNLSGYSEDVYGYYFAFCFDGYQYNTQNDDEEEN